MSIPYLTPLYAPALRELSIPEPWTFGMADRTRFGEIDALGHVNNTAHLRWAETLRVSYFKDYGVHDYGASEPPRIVIKSLSMGYHREMGVLQDYVVTARTVSMRNTSFRMEYGVWSAGALCASGDALIVWLDETGAKKPLPDTVRQVFIDRDGAEQT